jgi:1,4-alpha-glucan branching enzyme
MKKSYTKTGKSCRVTFELPAESNATEAVVCGEFNNWSPTENPLVKRKDGRLSNTISLKSGNSYRFRYLINGERWENDWDADMYLPNEFGTDDSIVQI